MHAFRHSLGAIVSTGTSRFRSGRQPQAEARAPARRSARFAAISLAGIFALLAAPAMAADWYASPTGLDANDCASAGTACKTIQAAINKAAAGDTVHVGVGGYAFNTASGNTGTNVYVTKSITLIGDGDARNCGTPTSATTSCAYLMTASTAVSGGRMIFVNNAANVTIENLFIEVNHSKTSEGVLALGTTNGLMIRHNYLNVISGGTSLKFNAISINPQSSGDRSSPTSAASPTYSQLSSVIENVIYATTSTTGARALLIELGGTTVTGNVISGGSTNDARVRWSSAGSVLIQNNSFGGRGLNVVEPNVGVTVRGNNFSSLATAVDNATSDASDYYQLRFDNATNAVVDGNTFSGFARYYRAVYVERSPGIQFTGNTFTPKNTGTIYDSIAVLVENKSANSNSPASAPTILGATFLRNTFNGSGVANKGYAVGLLNSNDPSGNTATFGAINFGSADPADANNFDGNLQWYVYLGDLRCNTGTSPMCPTANNMLYRNYGAYGGNPGTTTQAWPFRGDVTAFNNRFAGKFVADMTPAEYTAIAGKIYDKVDNAALGKVNYESFTPITTGTIVFSPSTFAYDGNAHAITATLQDDNTATCVVTPATVTAVGPNSVSATCTNAFYNVTGPGTITVTKGAGTAQLAQTSFTYTAADITLQPSMAQESSASCSANPATVLNAGHYTIHVTCTGTNYDAAGDIGVDVAKAASHIVLNPASFTYDNTDHMLQAQLADEPGTSCAGATPASVRTVGSYAVQVPACAGTNYTAPAANLTATVSGSTVVHVVETNQYYGSVADALADPQTLAGMTVEVAPGTYSGAIVLTKGVKLVASAGYTPSVSKAHPMAGPANPNPPVVIDGGNAAADGVTVANGVQGASISGFEIRNFTRHCVAAYNSNDGLSVTENVVHNCGGRGITVSGIAATGVSDVTIDSNEVYAFGDRGIVVWDGQKFDITITNNHVHNETGTGCCGIELQDGAAAGAVVTGNLVENTSDSGMAFIQLTSGSPSHRANEISGNTVTNTGRFGIEIKIPNGTGADTGDGAIVVENNTISTNTAAANPRDRAGIAVIRRSFGSYPAFQVDATNGVVVRNNQISGFHNANAGYEAYGLVVEGTAMSVSGNTLSGNDVGLQVQQANPNGLPPGDANQDAQTLWFNRGNAPLTCIDLGSNTYNTGTPNALDQRFQALPPGASMTGGDVTNQRTGQTYCSITAAVAAAQDNDTIVVAPVIHAENAVVTRPVHIIGAGQGQTTLVPAVYNPDCGGAPVGSQGSLCNDGTASIVMLVKASNVEISDLTVDGINPSLAGHMADIAARDGIMSGSDATYTGFKVHDTTVKNIWLRGIYSPSTNGTFEFRNNTVDNVKSDPSSIGIFSFYGGGIIDGNHVSNANDAIASNWSHGTTFSNNVVTQSGSGIHTDNSHGAGGTTNDLIENNQVSCGSVPGGYGIFVFANYADVTVQDNRVGSCEVGLGAFSGRTDDNTPIFIAHFLRNTVDGAGAVKYAPGDSTLGAYLSTTSFSYGEHDNAVELTGNTIKGFDVGVETERGSGKSLTTTANVNRLGGNTVGWQDTGDAVTASNGASNFTNNWWGCNDSPDAGVGCATASGTGTIDPWLVLSLPASPINIAKNASIGIAADLTRNSAGASVVGASALFPDATTQVTFGATNGASVTSPQNTVSGVATTTFSGLASGQSTVTATFENAHPTVVVQITPATITLDAGTLNQTYGSTQAVTATTVPANLGYSVTYDGSTTPPTNAGSYAVVATVTDNCCEGTASGTLVIARATTTVAFTPASVVYDGTTHAVTAHLTDEPATSCTVSGSPIGPNVNSYLVSTLACVGTNYTAPASNATIQITPASATLSLSHLVQPYDGSPKSVLVTTNPTGVGYSVSYVGTGSTSYGPSTQAPVQVGTYTATATVTDPNYTGTPVSGTLQIVSGNGDIALVVNGPVDPVHVGDTAEFAATMLANPALHQGEKFAYQLVLSKSAGNTPLALSDISRMEVFYGGNWVDVTTIIGGPLPLVPDGSGNLVYTFPDGIPGYTNGFPILDPSWTWNVRFTFATKGTYTTGWTLEDGTTHAAINPPVTGSAAVVVLDALPPTDIHLVLGGPAENVQANTPAEYTGTMLADPSLHTGEYFFVRLTVAKAGGTHALTAADLSAVEIYYQGSWQALPPGSFQPDGSGNLVYDFPQPADPNGFQIQDPQWTWNFRVTYADTGVYTATANVIHAADAAQPSPQVFASAAISTTVIAQVIPPPTMNLVLLGPVQAVLAHTPAEYTGTIVADPSQVTGRTFFVRVRLSKASAAMTAADLEKMELYQGGGWQDATAIIKPLLVVDGNDLVYYFPQPNAAFSIDQSVWSWHFRFTYADAGVYSASADVIDSTDAPLLGAASLAHAAIDTTVVAPSLSLGGQSVGAVTDASTPLYTVTSATTHLSGPALGENVLANIVVTRGGGATAGDVDLDYFALTQESPSCTATTTPANGFWCPLLLIDNGDGTLSGSYGPPTTGFPLTDGVTSYFRSLYHRGGQFTVAVSLDGISTGTGYASAMQTIDVAQLTISASGPANANTGATVDSSSTLTNSGTAAISTSAPAPDNENAIGQFTIASSAGALATTDLALSYLNPATSTYDTIALTANGDGTLSGSFGPSGGFPVAAGYNATSLFRTVFARAGNYTVTVRILGASSNTVYAQATQAVAVGSSSSTIAIDPASLSQTYNGGTHPVIVNTTPAGLSYTVTYDGSATPPTNAGDYTVVATIAQSGYSGTDTQTLHVAKAVGTVTFGATAFTFDGTAHSTTAVIAQESGNTSACVLTPTGDYPRLHAGSTSISAACNGTNYTASASTTLVVSPLPVTLSLSGLGSFVYDGADHGATATVTGAVSGYPATLTITYNGGLTQPNAVGVYNVLATLDPGDYTASPASGTIQITAVPTPNIVLSMSDGRDYAQYGKKLVYTIVVLNTGTGTASGLAIDDVLPVTLTAATWKCASLSNGATCGAATGSGDVHDSATLPASGVLIYTLTATVNDDPSLTTDVIVNTVTAGSASASDTTQAVIFRDGFETGGDGAQETGFAQSALTQLDDVSSTQSLTPSASSVQGIPQPWLRGVDASGRTLFRVDVLHVGTLDLMRLSVSDDSGNLVPGDWQPMAQFALGLSGSAGKYQMRAGGQQRLQLALPGWASLPIMVYSVH